MARLPTLCARPVRTLSKKVVFIIVEGPTDEEALHVLFERALADARVHIHVVHGDITSKKGITPANVSKSLYEMVKSYADNNGLRRSDFARVIHLMDTDGAFVDNSVVAEDLTATRPQYFDDEIRCRDSSRIVQRNDQKSKVMRRLAVLPNVWGAIPYEPFYMSCNLDHVLYNLRNLSDEEKAREAIRFSRKYHDDIPGFLNYICHSAFSVSGTRKETWQFIEGDNESLHRHSNLGNLFERDDD